MKQPLVPGGAPNSLNWKTVSQFIQDLTGILISCKDQASLQRYIQSRITALELDNELQYFDYVRRSFQRRSPSQEWSDLVAQITNGESYFFRDPAQLQLIGETLLPELIEHRRKLYQNRLIDRPYLTLWSAGCSTGEEPYSLAMLLQDLLPDIKDWRIHIIATDLNPHAIAAAQNGIYRDWSLRQINPRYKLQYFKRVEQGWQIDQSLRSSIQWDVLNLKQTDAIARRIPWASMDLILCRNVFIYFDTAAIAEVLTQFHRVLSPDGYLLAGHAELEGQDLSAFTQRQEPASMVYRKGSLHKFR